MWGFEKCTKNIIPRVSSTSNGNVMLDQNLQRAVVKNKDLLKIKSVRTTLSKVPILGDILFWVQIYWMQFH